MRLIFILISSAVYGTGGGYEQMKGFFKETKQDTDKDLIHHAPVGSQ